MKYKPATYYTPIVRFNNIGDDINKGLLKYIGTRVLTTNKNFLCCLTGQTGMGKSYAGLSLIEQYGKEFNIPFNVRTHVIHNLKQLLLLIKDKELHKNIQIGTALLFEEPQVGYNARNWQDEQTKMLSVLLSTFRNQRLVVFFTSPYLTMIDKQSRILFHAEFRVNGFDKWTGISRIAPRFLDYNGDMDYFYKKCLTIYYKIPEKNRMAKHKLTTYTVYKPSKEVIEEYEQIKKEFSENLVDKLLESINKKELQKDKEENNKINVEGLKQFYIEHGKNLLKAMEYYPNINASTIERYFSLFKRAGLKVIGENRENSEIKVENQLIPV